MEVLLTQPDRWSDAIAAATPDVVVCALGTTWAAAGRDEAEFRRTDHDLVLSCARWAAEAGVGRFIFVSSVGADMAARSVYLRTKGEVEMALGKIGFARLDIVRPGLLRGKREERRPLERIGQIVMPAADRMLLGGLSRYRSIRATDLADAILALAQIKTRGRYVHEHDALLRAIRRHVLEAGVRAAVAGTVD